MSNDRIKELEKDILKARVDYYNQQATVSDRVFDAWVDELRMLDSTNKAVTSVGAPVNSEWKKAKHQIPMGSLDKVNTPDELTKWVKDMAGNEELFVTEKLDGLSIEVIYDDGKLVQAITRGDGEIGEDITVNVIKMGGVKSKLIGNIGNAAAALKQGITFTNHNFTGSLRGEIIMTKTNHQKHFADKANPRNAASGVSKRLDSVGAEHLDILFYQVLGDIDFRFEKSQFIWLMAQGVKIPNFWLLSDAAEVNKFWRTYQDTNRADLDYDIDGLVIRLNDMDKQAALGDKDMRPKGAIAFKFDNEGRESTIRDIIWQVGNSGRLTPVAIIDPVQLVGATVTKASLYNMAYIEELGLDIGAKVIVVRANDVIPRIEELVKGTGKIAQPPKNCPMCSSYAKMDGENLVCVNTTTCPAQVIGRIKNWIKELNLLEWGDTLVEKLVESKKVSNVADLYHLDPKDIASLDRLGDKTANKVHEILWANTEVPLEVFLGALSIPMIGQSTIKAIMNAGCDTLEKFGQLKADNFEQVPGVGPTKANLLATGLKYNQQLITDILDAGVTIKKRVVGALTGKSICFTGSMKTKRPVLEKMAADAGADIKSSVGKGLTYLIIADPNSSSSKAVSARKLGTKLLSEEDFLELVE